MIAQTVKTELEAEGLDPSKYAFYCQDTGWYKDGVLLGDGITHGPGVYDKLNNEKDKSVLYTPEVKAGDMIIVPKFIFHYSEVNFLSFKKRIISFDFKLNL